MAIVTSNEYDHIDVVNGSNTNRHYIKDTTARNDIQDLRGALNGTASINAYKPTDFAKHNNITKNGITYTWQTDGSCIVSGTSTSNAAYTNMYENKAVLPWYFVPGESYDVIYSSTNVDLYINFFASDGTTSIFEQAYKANTTFIVPLEAHGAIVRLRVRNGKTANETVKPIIAYGKTNNEIATQLDTLADNIDDITSNLSIANDTIEANNNSANRKFDHSLIENKYYVTDYTDQTDIPNKNGVAYTWNPDGSCTCLGATTDSPSWVDLYNNSSALPDYVQSGKSYQLIYTGTNVRVYVAFYTSGTLLADNAYTANTVITVPNNADGLILRLHVLKNKTVDETVKPIIFYNPGVNIAKATNIPLMFSIVDDDTVNDDYVTKIHDNCLHNGVVCNYAIITKNVTSESTSVSKLQGYEEDGFGMLVHCYNQLRVFRNDENRDIQEVRGNMARAIREIREMNLLNAERFWVTPYGVHDADIVSLGRKWFDCLITTGSHAHNQLSDYDPYYIRRVDLYADDSESTGRMIDVKDAADVWAATGGWLIVTTHFKDWGNLTWDDTLDANGYPIGYARFNEMVQYLLAKGGTCVNFQEGFSYFKNVFGYNVAVL